MELRDVFATHAMQGILAGRSAVAYESVSNLAYIIADSMIAQRVAPEHPEDDE
jgi:hypothetical protein